MSRALDAVPQGGAKCTYTQALLLIRSLTKLRWSGLSRSNLRMGPFKRLGIMQSMPILSTNPRDLKLAVKRVVPAKTSNAKTWLICRPSADWPAVKLSLSQRCSCNEWGLKHPGSAQTCRPLEQLSPGLAALQPLGRLKPQQILCFWGLQSFVDQTCWDVWSSLLSFLAFGPAFGSSFALASWAAGSLLGSWRLLFRGSRFCRCTGKRE